LLEPHGVTREGEERGEREKREEEIEWVTMCASIGILDLFFINNTFVTSMNVKQASTVLYHWQRVSSLPSRRVSPHILLCPAAFVVVEGSSRWYLYLQLAYA
jgi:hypothetical protein